MSWWSRLFQRRGPVEPQHAPAAPEPSQRSDLQTPPAPYGESGPTAQPSTPTAASAGSDRAEWLERLERLGQPGGADAAEAVMRLRQLAGSADQTRALHALLGAMGSDPSLEPVRVACAGLLVERGEPEQAIGLLAPCRSVPAMMLAADLQAGGGQLARAVSTIERVLARAIDTPGARERHAQWCAKLGRAGSRSGTATGPDTGATMLAPRQDGVPFRLVREVARGGAGTVYEAEDADLGRRVAFKVYHQPERERDQLLCEVRSAVALAGPGVVRVYDASPEQGWIALEWIARGSLREAFARASTDLLVPLDRWLGPLCLALARVHRAGCVHGDIKPANVLLRSPGDPVLGDFGQCRAAGSRSDGGTPGYLSPERLEGAAADPRDDTYAVGRIVEDALAVLERAAEVAGGGIAGAAGPTSPAIAPPELARYGAITRACLSQAASRPANGDALLRWLAG